MTLLRFDFDDEPVGSTYATLLSEARRCCRLGMLVVRDQRSLDPAGVAALDRLAPFVVERTTADAWPGTRLTEDTAHVITFRFDSAAMRVLADTAPALYAWVAPLPEDLALLRGPRDPWLVTVAHERFAYLRLRPDEADDVRARLAPLSLSYAGGAGNELG